MLEIGQKITVKIIDIDYLGQGVARHDNRVIFIPGLINNEEAIIEIAKIKKNFIEAKPIKILKESEDRRSINPLNLTSLDLAHLSTEKQLAWQEKLTEDTFNKIANLKVKIEPIIHDDNSEEYRNKVVFKVLTKPYLTPFMFANNNSIKQPIDNFILANNSMNKLLKIIANAKIKVEDNTINALAFRTNSLDEVLVTIISTKKEFNGLKELVDLIKKQDKVVGVSLNIQDNPKQIFGRHSITLFGKNEITQYTKNNFKIVINDRSFYQTNFLIEKVYQIIKEDMQSNSIVIDAYSGVGSIGFSILDKTKKVFLVDINKDNINNARKTIFNNNLKNIEAILDDANNQINILDADILIVDPPRAGLNDKLIQSVLEKDFKKIYYLSCDLKTLVRDINLLTSKYTIEKVFPIKMFPHTTETETLVILKNNDL